MDKHKSFGQYFSEMLTQCYADRQAHPSPEPATPSARLRRVLAWLTPNGGTLLLIALLIATQSLWARPFAATTNAPGPSTTTVNYQGRLADNVGTPLDGNYGMSFTLYDAVSAGNLVGGKVSLHP